MIGRVLALFLVSVSTLLYYFYYHDQGAGLGPVTGHSSVNYTIKANPLPAPQSISWGDSGAIAIDRLSMSGDTNTVLNNAFKRTMKTLKQLEWTPAAVDAPFRPLIRPEDGPPAYGDMSPPSDKNVVASTAQNVRLKVADLDSGPHMDMDESYVLNVTHDSIDIAANTTWGALNAIKTFQQLVIYDEVLAKFIIEQPVLVRDEPQYTHRGVMLESSRHFLTVESMLRQIDAMAMAKLNVLHWHINDAQAWPLELDSVPELAQYGAYSKRERYSKKDVARIVDYAYNRGVRVVPELDLPGHSLKGWDKLDPELLACATGKFSNSVNNYQLDIMNDKVYEYLAQIYQEMTTMFKDDMFHVGADELDHNCFRFSKRIRDWFAEDPSRTDDDLLDHWFAKVLPVFNNTAQRQLVMWEDSVLSDKVKASNVPADVVMQTWNFVGSQSIERLIEKGHRVIVSSSDKFYLDCGYGHFLNGVDVQSVCGRYKSWQMLYGYNFTDGLTADQERMIAGAEVALWSEQVDSTVLDQKLWPRVGAFAELVWSGNKDASGQYRDVEMGQRLNNFREYLVANGVNAVPLQPKYCIEHPHVCDYQVYYGHV